MTHLKVLTVVSLTMVLSDCAAPRHPDAKTQTAIENSLNNDIRANQQQIKPSEPPSTVSQALIPPLEMNLPAKSDIDTEVHFDLKVDHSEAREMFMSLVKGTAYNMVIHPQVKGKVTLELKNVSVADVLETVRNVYGYDFERNGFTYYIYPNGIRTRLFKVNYLDVKRHGISKLKVSSGQVTQTATGRSGSSASSGSSSGSGGSRETVSASSIDTSSDSDYWNELQTALNTLIGKEKGRSVVISPQSGVIVVRAMPSELRAVEEYLKSTQVIMQRQVLLESKVVEVILSDGYQTGINWSALKTTDSSQILLSQVGGGSVFGSGVSSINGNSGDLNPGSLNQVAGSTTTAFGGVITAALNIGKNFSAFLELLKSQGDVQVLSSPQVATMNNQKAVIKVGTDEFFVTNVESSTNTGTTNSTTQNNVELTPFFSGVALDVIPQISEENDITLHIHPTVVDVTEKVKNISVSSSTTLSVPLAVSSIRESDTVIRAKSGQVVIIGGLMKNKKANDQAGVPWLGDLPLIGGLFRHSREAVIKSELVILLKPTVVEGAAQWAAGLRKTRENIRSMYPDQSDLSTEAVARP